MAEPYSEKKPRSGGIELHERWKHEEPYSEKKPRSGGIELHERWEQ